MEIGYKLSSEEHGSNELVRFATRVRSFLGSRPAARRWPDRVARGMPSLS